MVSNHGVEKVLVGLAIEHTLLQISKPIFDKVEKQFSEKYQCSIIDGYEHPQYLNEILKAVFGESYSDITKSIEEFLKEFRYEHSINTFIEKIKQ
ncbi:MAG: hypothetical protein WA799_08800 [Nitrosotalea sp.]